METYICQMSLYVYQPKIQISYLPNLLSKRVGADTVEEVEYKLPVHNHLYSYPHSKQMDNHQLTKNMQVFGLWE